MAEYFREGEEPLFGMLAVVDGGFGMSSDLPIFGRGEADDLSVSNTDDGLVSVSNQSTKSSQGRKLRQVLQKKQLDVLLQTYSSFSN